MINIGIIGGSGYTAGELIRILMYHPNAKIDFVYSTTNAGKPLSIAHHDLLGDIEMNFTDTVNPNVNVVFFDDSKQFKNFFPNEKDIFFFFSLRNLLLIYD